MHHPQTGKDRLLIKTDKVQTNECGMICFYIKAVCVYINVSVYAQGIVRKFTSDF